MGFEDQRTGRFATGNVVFAVVALRYYGPWSGATPARCPDGLSPRLRSSVLQVEGLEGSDLDPQGQDSPRRLGEGRSTWGRLPTSKRLLRRTIARRCGYTARLPKPTWTSAGGSLQRCLKWNALTLTTGQTRSLAQCISEEGCHSLLLFPGTRSGWLRCGNCRPNPARTACPRSCCSSCTPPEESMDHQIGGPTGDTSYSEGRIRGGNQRQAAKATGVPGPTQRAPRQLALPPQRTALGLALGRALQLRKAATWRRYSDRQNIASPTGMHSSSPSLMHPCLSPALKPALNPCAGCSRDESDSPFKFLKLHSWKTTNVACDAQPRQSCMST